MNELLNGRTELFFFVFCNIFSTFLLNISSSAISPRELHHNGQRYKERRTRAISQKLFGQNKTRQRKVKLRLHFTKQNSMDNNGSRWYPVFSPFTFICYFKWSQPTVQTNSSWHTYDMQPLLFIHRFLLVHHSWQFCTNWLTNLKTPSHANK